MIFFSTSLPGNPVYAVDLRTLQEVSLKAPSAAPMPRDLLQHAEVHCSRSSSEQQLYSALECPK